jgi:hypothetical protein
MHRLARVAVLLLVFGWSHQLSAQNSYSVYVDADNDP